VQRTTSPFADHAWNCCVVAEGINLGRRPRYTRRRRQDSMRRRTSIRYRTNRSRPSRWPCLSLARSVRQTNENKPVWHSLRCSARPPGRQPTASRVATKNSRTKKSQTREVSDPRSLRPKKSQTLKLSNEERRGESSTLSKTYSSAGAGGLWLAMWASCCASISFILVCCSGVSTWNNSLWMRVLCTDSSSSTFACCVASVRTLASS
jgi:hypothetical protein